MKSAAVSTVFLTVLLILSAFFISGCTSDEPVHSSGTTTSEYTLDTSDTASQTHSSDETYADTSEVSAETVQTPEEKLYTDALKMISEGKYEEAYKTLTDCGDFKDTEDLLKRFVPAYDKETAYGYDSNGDLSSTFTQEYKYDEKGKPVLYVSYDKDGKVTDRTEFQYSDDGSRKTAISYDADGNITSRFEYDQYGKWLDNHTFYLTLLIIHVIYSLHRYHYHRLLNLVLLG